MHALPDGEGNARLFRYLLLNNPKRSYHCKHPTCNGYLFLLLSYPLHVNSLVGLYTFEFKVNQRQKEKLKLSLIYIKPISWL